MKILAFALALTASAMSMAVGFHGAFATPGNYLPQGGRLLTGLQAAKPQQAYYLGGAVYRFAARAAQEKLKQNVLYDLRIARANAVDARVQRRLNTLLTRITAMQATGRIPAVLHPQVLANQAAKNIWLTPTDNVYLPSRPRGVYITGSVVQPGMFVGKQGDTRVVHLVRGLAHTNSKIDWAWVAQPDGKVQKVGVARWNQQLELSVAPGAIIVLPFDAKTMRGVEPNLAERLARWLATQPLADVWGL